ISTTEKRMTPRLGSKSLHVSRNRRNRLDHDLGDHRQMIRRASRERRRMACHVTQRTRRRYPDPVEREHGPARRKRARRRRHFTKVRMQPAQRTPPQVPLVQVAHEQRRTRAVAFDPGQYAANLLAPLAGTQTQVRRHDAQKWPQPEIDAAIERTARLVMVDREIEMLDAAHGKPGQYRIAEIRAVVLPQKT